MWCPAKSVMCTYSFASEPSKKRPIQEISGHGVFQMQQLKRSRSGLLPARDSVYAYGCIEELYCADAPNGASGESRQMP